MGRADTDAARVRRVYEQRPYPGTEALETETRRHLPASADWLRAVGGVTTPKRILVAGCGTGQEAFAFGDAFPGAEIVGVDFSPRSIAVARETQARHARFAGVRFLVGDLATRGQRGKTGGGFDLISCHGVLTYIPEPGRVLANLARCAAPDGALVLGVNGAQHCSIPARNALPLLGVEPAELHDEPGARRALRLCDAIQGHRGPQRLANRFTELLASDVFGPLTQNWPLAAWDDLAKAAGWHLQASFHVHRDLRDLWPQPAARRLLTWSRAEAARLADALLPTSFHRLVFRRQPEARPPWDDPAAILGWKPAATGLYTASRAKKAAGGCRQVRLQSAVLETQLDWSLPEWGAALLRHADGRRSLREILAGKPVPAAGLRRLLCQFYHLFVLDLRPPDRT